MSLSCLLDERLRALPRAACARSLAILSIALLPCGFRLLATLALPFCRAFIAAIFASTLLPPVGLASVSPESRSWSYLMVVVVLATWSRRTKRSYVSRAAGVATRVAAVTV